MLINTCFRMDGTRLSVTAKPSSSPRKSKVLLTLTYFALVWYIGTVYRYEAMKRKIDEDQKNF